MARHATKGKSGVFGLVLLLFFLPCGLPFVLVPIDRDVVGGWTGCGQSPCLVWWMVEEASGRPALQVLWVLVL